MHQKTNILLPLNLTKCSPNFKLSSISGKRSSLKIPTILTLPTLHYLAKYGTFLIHSGQRTSILHVYKLKSRDTGPPAYKLNVSRWQIIEEVPVSTWCSRLEQTAEHLSTHKSTATPVPKRYRKQLQSVSCHTKTTHSFSDYRTALTTIPLCRTIIETLRRLQCMWLPDTSRSLVLIKTV